MSRDFWRITAILIMEVVVLPHCNEFFQTFRPVQSEFVAIMAIVEEGFRPPLMAVETTVEV